MSKRDKNGVSHSGWDAVGESNRNHRGYSGKSDKEYESLASSQGVDLDHTLYRKTSGYSYNSVPDSQVYPYGR